MTKKPGRLTAWLNGASPFWFASYTIFASFCTYFCMYAFRKPFAAATYADYGSWMGLDLKTAYVISQIIGYATSKFISIRICSELSAARRALSLLALILAAECALVLFAVLPPKMKVAAIFLNGLPLGMVWGLVVRYLEGRHLAELLLAGLSCSYIVASGMVKDIGLSLLSFGVSEAWMPAATGLCFVAPFALSVWLLNQLPIPSPDEVKSRVERPAMFARDRWLFFGKFWFGFVMVLAAYFLFTAYRDIRDNYGIEVLRALGYAEAKAIFTKTELPVALGVLASLAALNLIRNHRLGLIGTYVMMLSGLVLMLASTLAMDAGWLRGIEVWWMIAVGLGAYLAYVPYGTNLFERLIASTRVRGNAVFAICLADAVGYSGSVLIQISKDLMGFAGSRFDFLRMLTYVVAVLGVVLLAASSSSFLARTSQPDEGS